MSVARIFECKGWTTEQYDELIRRMGLDGHSAAGVEFHAAMTVPGGLRVVDVYESVEAADRLATERIVPIATELGLTPPEVTQLDVLATLTPA